MLSSKGRLNKRDFELVYRKGKTLYQGNIIVKFLKNDIGEKRLGISVGLKFSSKAVERNRMKRKIRDFWRKNKQKIHSGWDVVVIVKKNKSLLGQEIEETEVLQKVLKKAVIMN